MKHYHGTRENHSGRVFGLTFDRFLSAIGDHQWAMRIELTCGRAQWYATIHYGRKEKL